MERIVAGRADLEYRVGSMRERVFAKWLSSSNSKWTFVVCVELKEGAGALETHRPVGTPF